LAVYKLRLVYSSYLFLYPIAFLIAFLSYPAANGGWPTSL
jgi:hypothetical protein